MAISFPDVTDQESRSPLDDGKYLFKVVDLEDAGVNDYGAPRIKWITNVAEFVNNNWVGKNNDDGTPYEKWIFTNLPKGNESMGPNNETRLMIEAIIGRPLSDGERPSPDLVMGKYFTAILGPYRRKRDGKLTQIINKDSITAYSPAAKKAAAAPVAPEPDPEADDSGF